MVLRNNRKFALVMANAGFTLVLREQKKKEENSETVCDTNITVGANKPFCKLCGAMGSANVHCYFCSTYIFFLKYNNHADENR